MSQTRGKKLFSIGAAFMFLALTLSFTSVTWADGKSSEVRIRTPLSGGTLNGQVPSGHADFRSEAARSRSRLNVEVENVALKDGTTLNVFFVHAGNSTKIGVIHLVAGFGELELNAQDGDTPPAVASGDMVTVNNAGSPILSGVFNN